jgi:outer membrane protein TolC
LQAAVLAGGLFASGRLVSASGQAPVPQAPAPAAQAPVSQTPVSQTPVSQTPVSQTPVSQTPASQAPAPQTPVSQTPVSQTPASQAPAPQSPVSQAPASQAPGTASDPTAAQTGPTLRLTADEAVRMALENNLGIRAERLAPEISTLAVAQARAAYAPNFFSNFSTRSSTQPPSSFITGGGSLLTTESFSQSGGFGQNIPWGGGRYSFSLDGGRITTSSIESRYNPQLSSNLQATLVQPLLRNFAIDSNRQQIQTSRNNQVIADIGLREQVAITTQAVRNTYFDLIGAEEGYRVARQSLGLALESLKNNQTKVEVGTLAPIDIIEAEAEVASNEEAVINAEARIKTLEDRLRALVMNPSQGDFWTVRLEPADPPTLTPVTIDVQAAITNALANRTDIARLKKQLDNVDIGIRFARNQNMPGLDLTANYNAVGFAGTQFVFGSGFPPPIESQSQRAFSDALRDVFGQNFRTWSVQLNFNYPIGTSQAQAGLASARLQRQQGNVSLQDLELQVATAVRDAARQVDTNLKRVEATRKARDFAERRLEAQTKRMTVGLSTTFELFQAQRDLARQRQQEVNAMIDYNRSIVAFETIQTAPAR